MILQANFGRVGQYINVVSNVVIGILLAVLAVRYVRCFRAIRPAA